MQPTFFIVSTKNVKHFFQLIQTIGIITGLLIVGLTYWYIIVSIQNIELYSKELLQQETPILDFRIMNDKVEIDIVGNKWNMLVSKSVRLIQLNQRVRLNLVKVDFSTRMRELRRNENIAMHLPVFLVSSLNINPPEFAWGTDPIFELIKHYYRNEELDPNTQSYYFNEKIPISLTQRYNCFGEVRKVIGIYGVEYDVFVDRLNDKVLYYIEIKNIYLIKTLEANENHIDELNSIFDSFAKIAPLSSPNG